jgi:hypothetical protein
VAEVWLLIFLFTNGQVYASGPYDLETCKEMAAAQRVAACVHKDKPRERAVEVKR